MYGNSSMATQGGEESQRRLERQRARLCQEGRAQSEAPSTRGRQQARLFLRPDERHEIEAYERQDRKRPGFED